MASCDILQGSRGQNYEWTGHKGVRVQRLDETVSAVFNQVLSNSRNSHIQEKGL